jgi:UDP-glucose 4-epimerase
MDSISSRRCENLAALEKQQKTVKSFSSAAQTSVPFSMDNPTEDCEINVVGTVNALEAAKKQGPE